MHDEMYMTPPVWVDGAELAFVGNVALGREAELFATLLTFTTFSEMKEAVIDEVYSNCAASTGATMRLTEERWYEVAKEYFDEFTARMRTASPDDLLGHYRWLDQHFFAKHKGYEALRDVLNRVIARPPGRPLH